MPALDSIVFLAGESAFACRGDLTQADVIIEDNIQLAVATNDFRATQRCVVSPENKSLAEEMAAAIPI